MLKKMMHDPVVRNILRTWRPLYNRVFRRQKDLSRDPTPSEYLRRMHGRGVFLLSFGRSGTTVFADFLGTHPKVTSFGEVLNEDSYYSFFQWFSRRALRWWSFRPSLMEVEFYKFIEELVRKAPGFSCMFDMKIEGLHLIEGNWRLPWTQFKLFDVLQESGAPVILLERRDLVARHISGQIAQRRGRYHSYHEGTSEQIKPFAVDIALLDLQVRTIEAQYDVIRDQFKDYERFEILVYEDLFDTTETGESRFAVGLSGRMAKVLGVEDLFDTVPRLQKVSNGGYEALITNMEEVNAYRAQMFARQGAAVSRLTGSSAATV